jgi:hypothetical protein
MVPVPVHRETGKRTKLIFFIFLSLALISLDVLELNLNALWRGRLSVLFADNERSGCRRPSKPRRCNERRGAQHFTSGSSNSSPRTVQSPPRSSEHNHRDRRAAYISWLAQLCSISCCCHLATAVSIFQEKQLSQFCLMKL